MSEIQITITFEELLALLDKLTPEQRAEATARLAARSTLTDDDYYSMENVNRRMYERARRHWREVGDSVHLQLSDAEMDEQFWGFDKDGIPRLKSEVTDTTPPLGSAAALATAAKQHTFVSGDPTVSARSREILNNEFADYLLERTKSEDSDAS